MMMMIIIIIIFIIIIVNNMIHNHIHIQYIQLLRVQNGLKLKVCQVNLSILVEMGQNIAKSKPMTTFLVPIEYLKHNSVVLYVIFCSSE